MNRKKKHIRGIITIPFLLVLVIVLFFTLAFLMLTMTFAHVTVTQYLTYSSARKLSLAGESQDDQVNSAISHYEILRLQFFKSDAHTGKTGDWFDIETATDLKQNQSKRVGADMLRWYKNTNPYLRTNFYGLSTRFNAEVLNLQIPFLIEGDSDDLRELVYVSSFLGREPSKAECEDYHKKRKDKIIDYEKNEKANGCNNSKCPYLKPPEILVGDNGC